MNRDDLPPLVPRATNPEEPLLKGVVFQSRRDFVMKRWGGVAWDKVLNSLKPASRLRLQGAILGTSWYPLALNEELDRAICTLLAGGDPGIWREMGASSAEIHFPASYPGLLGGHDALDFLKKTETLAKRFYSPCTAKIEVKGDGHVVLHSSGYVSNETNCASNLGFMQRGVEICGGTDVRVRELKCTSRGDRSCDYEVRWTGPSVISNDR